MELFVLLLLGVCFWLWASLERAKGRLKLLESYVSSVEHYRRQTKREERASFAAAMEGKCVRDSLHLEESHAAPGSLENMPLEMAIEVAAEVEQWDAFRAYSHFDEIALRLLQLGQNVSEWMNDVRRHKELYLGALQAAVSHHPDSEVVAKASAGLSRMLSGVRATSFESVPGSTAPQIRAAQSAEV